MDPLRALAVLLLLASAAPAAPARAADPVTKFEPDKLNPEAKKVNERNPAVIHAGPGAPVAGQRYEPPKAGKGSPAVGGAGGH
jgi:hypothetical protein